MELCVFGLGRDEHGNVRVGVFPERQEILIRRLGLGGVALHGIGTGEAEMGQCAYRFVQRNPAMIQNLLELGCGFLALMCGPIRISTYVDGMQSSEHGTLLSQLIRSRDLKDFNCVYRIVAIESKLRAN